jgi:pimeloyl-ACP methyl ester carboxylesterase
MEPLQVVYKNAAINYYRFGSGPQPVLCFHGYGEAATAFQFLAKQAGNQFSFFCIDLPFHGKTVWNEELLFTLQDLQEIIGQIVPSTNHRFFLMGFSLGGRVALSLYQAMPDRVAKLILLAPDGLKVNGWYWLATQTWLGNKLFAFTMQKPGWFFGMLKVMNKLKLINASIFKFVNHYISDAEVRRLLYTRWTALRKLKPDIQQIKQIVSDYQTPVRLVYGKHDRIILSSVGEKFRKGIEDNCLLTIISSGHQVLHEKHAAEIVHSLYE